VVRRRLSEPGIVLLPGTRPSEDLLHARFGRQGAGTNGKGNCSVFVGCDGETPGELDKSRLGVGVR
jgi:hypothetical protein